MNIQRAALVVCATLAMAGGVVAQDKVSPQATGQFRGVYATIDISSSQKMELRLTSGSERRAAVREVLKNPGFPPTGPRTPSSGITSGACASSTTRCSAATRRCARSSR